MSMDFTGLGKSFFTEETMWKSLSGHRKLEKGSFPLRAVEHIVTKDAALNGTAAL